MHQLMTKKRGAVLNVVRCDVPRLVCGFTILFKNVAFKQLIAGNSCQRHVRMVSKV